MPSANAAKVHHPCVYALVFPSGDSPFDSRYSRMTRVPGTSMLRGAYGIVPIRPSAASPANRITWALEHQFRQKKVRSGTRLRAFLRATAAGPEVF